MLVQVALTFCESLLPPPGAEPVVVSVDLDEKDAIAEAKDKIARALVADSPSSSPKRVTGDMLMLHFGPNDAVIGRAYAGDPTCDETTEKLGDHSALAWLRRFPRWRLGVRPMPPPPPPPGEAAHRAAAQAEGKDPDKAVEEARAKGEIPKLSDLPAPWGRAPLPESAKRQPPRWPEESSPAKTSVVGKAW